MQLAVSTSLIKITSKATRRFSPSERKCWEMNEINLTHLPYADDYRYEMSNCLFEAAMQEAYGKEYRTGLCQFLTYAL